MKKYISIAIAAVCIMLSSCTEDSMPSNMAFGTSASGGTTISDAISASVTSLSFSADGGSESVTITSNFAWSVLSSPSWITVSPSSGSSSDTSLTVTADKSTSTSDRTGTITIGKSSASVSITVSQQSSSESPVYAIQLAAGATGVTYYTGRSFLLKSDGILWAWGSNYYGQLGDGTMNQESYQTTPVKILNDVKQVAAGDAHALAIKTDGTLWAWGQGAYGELGPERYVSFVPVKIMDNVSQVAVGTNHSMAIKEDGTLWTWGKNDHGQLGNGTLKGDSNPTPTYIMDNVSQIAAGWLHSLAIKRDGTLWAWGSNSEGQIGDETNEERLLPVKIMNGVKKVVAGERHSLVIKEDDSLWGWGYNSNGCLGIGTNKYENPTPVIITDDVSQVAAGSAHTLVLKRDGTLWVCGSNHSGQCGTGITGNDANVITLTYLMSNVELVCAAGDYSLVVKSDGTLWGWGDNRYGQLGNGTYGDNVFLPVQCFSVSSLQ